MISCDVRENNNYSFFGQINLSSHIGVRTWRSTSKFTPSLEILQRHVGRKEFVSRIEKTLFVCVFFPVFTLVRSYYAWSIFTVLGVLDVRYRTELSSRGWPNSPTRQCHCAVANTMPAKADSLCLVSCFTWSCKVLFCLQSILRVQIFYSHVLMPLVDHISSVRTLLCAICVQSWYYRGAVYSHIRCTRLLSSWNVNINCWVHRILG